MKTKAIHRGSYVLLGCLWGCSGIHTHRPNGEEIVMSQDEFTKYAEDVFRHHNQVMAELIDADSDRSELDSDESKKLKTAEKQMVSSCQPLNDIVAEEMSGEQVGIDLKLDVIDAVPACEAATLHVEDLIP